jgi:hypothetical protein
VERLACIYTLLLVTDADESRRQIVLCLPVYDAGIAISPCGAEMKASAHQTKKNSADDDSLVATEIPIFF